jgi:type IV pilus assembly protein PilF
MTHYVRIFTRILRLRPRVRKLAGNFIITRERHMKKVIKSFFWLSFVILPLMACATSEYNVEKNKAISKDLQRLADAYYRQGDYTNALRYYLDSEKNYPDDPELQYQLGMTYQEKMNYPRAEEHFRRALTLKPDLTKAKIGLSVCYLKAEDYDQAITLLKQTIEDLSFEIYTKPQYPKYLLGWAYHLKREYPESSRYLQESLDYYSSGVPKDAIYIQALRAMGLNALAQSKPEEALSYFEKVIPFAPKWPDLYMDMAHAHRLAGDATRARQAYQRVIELAPASDLADTAAKEEALLK